MIKPLYLACLISLTALVKPNPDVSKAPCTNWTINVEKGNAKVYVRECDDSPIKEIKVTDKFSGNFAALTQLMREPGTTKKMSDRCTESRLIQRLDAQTTIQYFVFAMPFGVSDREVVVKNVIHISADRIESLSQETESDAVPVKKNLVRMKSSMASFVFYKTSDGMIQMEYIGRADPNGIFPPWIVNLFAKKEALKMIEKLKSLAQN